MKALVTRRGMHTVANGGAWFFILASLLYLAGVAATLVADPSGSVALYETTTGGEAYRAWGLAYEGVGGLVRVVTQAAIVILAAVFSLAPWRRMRRIGHVVLLVWAGWWAANVTWLAGIDGAFDTTIQAAFLTALAGCTAWRAWRGWTPKTAPAVPVTVEVEIGHVEAAAQMLEATETSDGAIANARRLAGSAGRRIASWWTPDRKAAAAGSAKRTGLTIRKSVAAGARHARNGARRGVVFLRERGVLPA